MHAYSNRMLLIKFKMEYFTHLAQYQVIVCNKCQYAVLPSRLDSHLASAKHRVKPVERKQIKQEIATWAGLLQNEADLMRLEIPTNKPPPLAALEIHPRGKKCRQ